jgi:hypothetical protein
VYIEVKKLTPGVAGSKIKGTLRQIKKEEAAREGIEYYTDDETYR